MCSARPWPGRLCGPPVLRARDRSGPHALWPSGMLANRRRRGRCVRRRATWTRSGHRPSQTKARTMDPRSPVSPPENRTPSVAVRLPYLLKAKPDGRVASVAPYGFQSVGFCSTNGASLPGSIDMVLQKSSLPRRERSHVNRLPRWHAHSFLRRSMRYGSLVFKD
jgi:hypothetical protein